MHQQSLNASVLLRYVCNGTDSVTHHDMIFTNHTSTGRTISKKYEIRGLFSSFSSHLWLCQSSRQHISSAPPWPIMVKYRML